jgi:hypothetical protein
MKKTTVGSLAATAALLFVLGPSSAWAQATRTWVSGVGDDANPCSRTAPCKTFAGAISKTAAGGEINAIDPGGFGVVTITKSITIDGGGTMAAILASQTTGVIVNAGAADKVILRNLSINGAGNGLRGIRFLAGGSLVVENVVINGFTGSPGIGISFEGSGATAKLFVTNTTVANNLEGIVIAPTGGATKALINGCRLVNNTGGAAFRVQSFGTAVVTDTVASGNSTGFTAFATTNAATLDLQASVVSNNTFGVVAGLGAGAAFVRLSDVMITENGTGLFNDANGHIESYLNNKIVSNGTNGAPTSTLGMQ